MMGMTSIDVTCHLCMMGMTSIDVVHVLRRDHQKISYERHGHESIEEKSLSQVMSRKTTLRRIREVKG